MLQVLRPQCLMEEGADSAIETVVPSRQSASPRGSPRRSPQGNPRLPPLRAARVSPAPAAAPAAAAYLVASTSKQRCQLKKEVTQQRSTDRRERCVQAKVQKLVSRHTQVDRKSKVDEESIRTSATFKVQMQVLAKATKYVMKPGESRFLKWWDLAGAVALTVTATYTPFEVSFMPEIDYTRAWATPRFLLARLLDFYFVSDLVLHFFISYRKIDTAEDGHTTGVWVYRHRDIALHYLSTWCLFDVITIAPSVFDILPTVSPGFAGGSETHGATILRTFRILRFVKIVRVARAARIFQRWSARISLPSTTQTVLWCIVQLVFAVHWFACVFALQASMHHDPQVTWMGEHVYGYCANGYFPERFSHPPSPPPDSPSVTGVLEQKSFYELCYGLSPAKWYIGSFTWALMIITGTGGTDFWPNPKSEGETVKLTRSHAPSPSRLHSRLWAHRPHTFPKSHAHARAYTRTRA